MGVAGYRRTKSRTNDWGARRSQIPGNDFRAVGIFQSLCDLTENFRFAPGQTQARHSCSPSTPTESERT
jgi:hypothetical protein